MILRNCQSASQVSYAIVNQIIFHHLLLNKKSQYFSDKTPFYFDIFCVAVCGGGYILAVGGWWWIEADIFWLSVGGGGWWWIYFDLWWVVVGVSGYILASGGEWWHILV